jgi:hypothetical protein
MTYPVLLAIAIADHRAFLTPRKTLFSKPRAANATILKPGSMLRSACPPMILSYAKNNLRDSHDVGPVKDIGHRSGKLRMLYQCNTLHDVNHIIWARRRARSAGPPQLQDRLILWKG